MLWLPPLAALLAVAACGAYLKLARHWQLLDHPNHRSSHSLPTPHGGGVPLLLSLAVAVLAAGGFGVAWSAELRWLLGFALALMALGVLDDLVGLSVRLRFAVYALCCLVAAALLMAPLGPLAWWLLLPVGFALLWGLNLFNFMDGIDGIAAIQCFMASCAAALLAFFHTGAGEYALFCLLLGFCHLGFLAWNFPPARLFMGDAGSVPTGFLLGALAVLGEVSGALSAATWLVLLAAFVADASYTLLRRLLRGERITEAHREHLYQRLSRRWHSHLAVDLALLATMALWLFPLAWAVQTFEQYRLFLVILAYLPPLIYMAKSADFT
nr:glycosyltransferase family 4 protein [Parahaliea mediterranea]